MEEDKANQAWKSIASSYKSLSRGDTKRKTRVAQCHVLSLEDLGQGEHRRQDKR